MIYAHSLPDMPEQHWQTLEDHQTGVATLAAAFAAFGLPKTARLLGDIHDTGKRSRNFQDRLRGKKRKVDHTSAAYLYLRQEWGPKEGEMLAKLLAYPLLGHHGGMPDCGCQTDVGTLLHRLSDMRLQSAPDWKSETAPPLPAMETFLQELQPFMCLEGKRPDAFATAFLCRMLFSCLVDADFLDTERFCSPDRHRLRPACPAVESLETALFQHLRDRNFLQDEQVSENTLLEAAHSSCGTPERREAIRLARLFMLQRCIAAAEARPGIFSLTMPTGGGKTFSSLAFALRHARNHNLRRVILVVPYTSIIEQNADVLRQALGEDAVLEHHSTYVHPEETDTAGEERSSLSYKLSTENWDVSLIVTTSVQFFESLFDNRPSRCRKLHNIARSVVILDEVQTLPVIYVKPCLAALQLLAAKYGTSIVLCTATQPAFCKSSFLEVGFAPEEVYTIIPQTASPTLFRIFERATVEIGGLMDDDALADRIRQEKQVLCIVNSRTHARELFTLLDNDAASFHLSARMTPHHRTSTLAQIRQRLTDGLPCRVVSTSLIECGVDISFPLVIREKNGLDVLAQAAGRCNREGRESLGRVLCFTSPTPAQASDLNRKRQAFDDVASREDLFCPKTVQAYFNALYRMNRHLLDEKGILANTAIEWTRTTCIWQFQFSTIARNFRFIEDDTVSLVIENTEAASLLRQTDIHGALSPATVRKLQRFSVQVYRSELERLKKDGRIAVQNGFLHVLSGGIGYSERTGLDLTLENGVPVDDLLF